MARIKVCPHCNKRNSTLSSQCSCGESLMDVKAISEELYEKQLADKNLENEINEQSDSVGNSTTAKNQIESNSSTSESKSDYIKICPECGFENLGVAKICKNCKANIKLVKPEFKTKKKTPDNASSISNSPLTNNPQNETNFVGRLCSPDDEYSFDIDSLHPIIQIGREASMSEYLEERMFTSRIHAEIHVVGKKLAIKDLGKPNGTYVNNVRISPNNLKLLECGDKVSLGGKWEDDWKQNQAGCFIVCYDD